MLSPIIDLLKEARFIIEEAETILSTLDSMDNKMSSTEIKNKARRDGNARYLVYSKEIKAKRAKEEAKRQEERQLKEQEEQKLRDEIELKRKEARRIALEQKRIELEQKRKAEEEKKRVQEEERHLSTFTGVKNLVRIANGQGKYMCVNIC